MLWGRVFGGKGGTSTARCELEIGTTQKPLKKCAVHVQGQCDLNWRSFGASHGHTKGQQTSSVTADTKTKLRVHFNFLRHCVQVAEIFKSKVLVDPGARHCKSTFNILDVGRTGTLLFLLFTASAASVCCGFMPSRFMQVVGCQL